MIIYAGKYHSAALYARWLSEMTGQTTVPFDGIERESVPQNEPVIAICSLYAGGLHGSKKIRKFLERNSIGSFVLLSCGLSNPRLSHQAVQAAAEKAFAGSSFTLFCLRGGIDYNALSRTDRLMMAMLKKAIEKKPAERFIERQEQAAFLETYGQRVFFETPEQLAPVISFLKTI